MKKRSGTVALWWRGVQLQLRPAVGFFALPRGVVRRCVSVRCRASHRQRPSREGRNQGLSAAPRRAGLLPKRKRFPVGGCAHAAKDERCCGLEQGVAAFFPLGFGAYDAHAVGAERKNRECRRVSEARLAVEAFNKRREARGASNPLREGGDNVEVPEARMVCADVPCVLQGHEPLPEYVGADMEHVGNRFLDIIGETVVVECNRSKRHDFHHRPDWRIVRDAVLGRKMPYLWVIGCLVRGIGYSREKPAMLCRRQFRHVRGVDVCERIADEIGMAFGVLAYGFIIFPVKKKIPVATIDRSLSGGVTGANYIKSRRQKQWGKFE